MTTPQIKIVNSKTGEEIVRDMNADELAQWEIDKTAAKADSDEAATRKAEKSALLAKLGITADEAALLLS